MWRFRATQKSLPSLEAAIFQAMKVAIRRVKQRVMIDLTNNMTKQSAVQTAPEILKSTPSSLHHITLHMALSENRLPQNVIFCWGGKPNISIYIYISLYILILIIHNHPIKQPWLGKSPINLWTGYFGGCPASSPDCASCDSGPAVGQLPPCSAGSATSPEARCEFNRNHTWDHWFSMVSLQYLAINEVALFSKSCRTLHD